MSELFLVFRPDPLGPARHVTHISKVFSFVLKSVSVIMLWKREPRVRNLKTDEHVSNTVKGRTSGELVLVVDWSSRSVKSWEGLSLVETLLNFREQSFSGLYTYKPDYTNVARVNVD